MRYKLRLFIVILVAHALVAVFIWSWFINADITEQPRVLAFATSNLGKSVHDKTKEIFKEIPCNINGEYNISCRKESGEIYLPFTFIKKYFEVYGKLVEKDGSEVFNWSHSYANYYSLKKKYDPRGIFTHFQSYKVEERERVKCISAAEGVPLSTQWDPKGYYYPTQIAQFGLSHYSKGLLEPEPVKRVLEDGENNQANWIVSGDSSIRRDHVDDANSQVLCFDANFAKPITLIVNDTLPILSFDLKLDPDKEFNEFVVGVRHIGTIEWYILHYHCRDEHITAEDNEINYGLFCNGRKKWYTLSRDIFIDIQKGVMLKTKVKPKFQRSSLQLNFIQLRGKGCIDNITLASNNHMTQFYFTVDWLLKHQDETTGGWPNPVTRKMAGSLILKPGWYSAMGQGHGLSVLARAYHLSDRNTKYLEAARKALDPFKVLSKNHGVLAMYMHELHWYEEYPTEPATFVLNGFIYSLIGLYDFHTLAPVDYSHEPYMLYVQGRTSLKKLLLAFDTGSGTTYDLRHMTLGIAPKLARWDYHATHINQLLLLSTIDKDPLFSNTAKRWIGYMSGKRASHN